MKYITIKYSLIIDTNKIICPKILEDNNISFTHMTYLQNTNALATTQK